MRESRLDTKVTSQEAPEDLPLPEFVKAQTHRDVQWSHISDKKYALLTDKSMYVLYFVESKAFAFPVGIPRILTVASNGFWKISHIVADQPLGR